MKNQTNQTNQKKDFSCAEKIERQFPCTPVTNTMATIYELERLEQMIKEALEFERARAAERKAAMAEITRPYTAEEHQAAMNMVVQANEAMRLSNLSRNRRRSSIKKIDLPFATNKTQATYN